MGASQKREAPGTKGYIGIIRGRILGKLLFLEAPTQNLSPVGSGENT